MGFAVLGVGVEPETCLFLIMVLDGGTGTLIGAPYMDRPSTTRGVYWTFFFGVTDKTNLGLAGIIIRQ
jgi:hypothetical protein